MVQLRSSTGAKTVPEAQVGEENSLLDSSSEFLALDSPPRSRHTRSAQTSRSQSSRSKQQQRRRSSFSNKDDDNGGHVLRSQAKKKIESDHSDSSLDKSNESVSTNNTEERRFTRRLARLQADATTNGKEDGLPAEEKQSLRTTRSSGKTDAHEVNGDVEVRRSGRIRRSRYSTTNQSVLFDKLITNTAEAVLQKMDDMKKMRRRRMLELDMEASNDTEEDNLDMYSRVKRKRKTTQIDEEATDNQEESEDSSEVGEVHGAEDEEEDEDEDEDGEEDNQKRYEQRQRKTVVPYQVPLQEPRHHKKRDMFYATSTSPARSYRYGSPSPKSPYSKKIRNRRRHAIHSSDSTTSSSADEDFEVEPPLNRGRSKAASRCLPMNFRRDDLKSVHKDRMKIGASLADVDPMQIDTSVRFSSVGGLSRHIASLKEMLVFPLLYPQIYESFKMQPPRGCLFYGPPGTGKTLVARALANECSVGEKRVAFFMRKGADCLSKWIGESERQLRLLFDQAYQMRPSIIFFDEIDGLAPVRSSRQDQIHSSIVSTLLALMDGLDSRGEVLVIGATNRLDSIDPALRRPGRFDREFLFNLPDKDARLEILKIHTNEWNPKPSELFLQELAEKCVGYCGADIKSVCAEAALCALRRRYPQIYTTSDKLLLDISSIQINAKDFISAMQKTVPASQRAVVSSGQALSSITQPLLQNTLQNILVSLNKVFPHTDEGLKNKESGSSDHMLEEDLLYSDDEQPSVYENGIGDKSANCQKKNHQGLYLRVNANRHPTSYRPRMLLSGNSGLGQGTHLAPAVIHALEKFTVYTLDLAVLFGASVVSPEENCAQMFHEAKRTAPSILYIPHIHLWWNTVSDTLKATFLSLLKNIPSFSPILVLSTCDVTYAHLPSELKELFLDDYGEVFHVPLPSEDERRAFFEDLILNQAAKPPASKRKAVLQALEVLPVAPPPKPQELTAEELKKLEEQEEGSLRELRLFLRDVTQRLYNDKRFRAFTKPVDLEEVPDYVTVIAQPMDLSTMTSKIDLHKYQTVREYLKDIDLICNNALEYNPDKVPGDRLIRHRACTLRDAAYAIITQDLNNEFEKLCEEIQESRKKRGYSLPSKHLPSYYHVLPKSATTQDAKKTDTPEKASGSALPVAASTPCTAKRKYKRKNRWCAGVCSKKKKASRIEKNEEPECDTFLELQESNVDPTEVQLVYESSMEADNGNLEGEGVSKETLIASPTKDVFVESVDNVTPTKNGDHPETSGISDVCVSRMTRAKQMQVEQQKIINVDKLMDILSEPAQSLQVNLEHLKELLNNVVDKSSGYNVLQLEKLYALLSQCIYRHRKDYDKAQLIQVMEQEVSSFRI